MSVHDIEDAMREARDGLGLEYEPPETQDNLQAARGIYLTAFIGYCCWGLIIYFIWG